MSKQRLTKLTPDSAQEKAIERIIGEPTKAALNASVMGVGKSLMATEIGLRLGSKVVLIIAPLGTYYGWLDTIARQTDYQVELHKIDSTKNGKAIMDNLTAKQEGWYFIGREYFRTKYWKGIVPDLAIVDEAHFAQNRNSKSFKVLKTLKAGFKLSMSGTPFGNKFEGAWAVTRWLWGDKIPKSYWSWVYDWCQTGYSPFTKIDVLGELKPGAFAKSLPCYVRLESQEKLQVVEETRYVDLVPAQRKIYEKFEKDLVVWLGENPMIAEVPIAARIRLRQITLAVPTIGDEGEVMFADEAVSTKFKALQEIIDDNPDDTMLLLTDSQKYANLVTKRLNKTKNQAFEWSGKANQAQREDAKQKFLRGEIKYIVAVIPAIAEGVDGLQNACSTVVWLSHSDSNLLNQQVLDRIRRRGQKETVKVYDIVARGTYDEGQISNLLERQLQMNKTLRQP